ncbi:hypothetical protein QCB45_00040 [Thiomicrorhabdus sp. ZW0627]|uniref:hypothetical protein n=1 Tax=Thiomicrorhabdus sp. ZW0627 TaxID=3039774 RepID=UPI0024367F26|nr:hypothetical protein [Thiomicrorhabdus sp. ZW0627]MDG6772717.1 hypothetical protein [Thiomicrorhabdus sp. ZW0627]
MKHLIAIGLLCSAFNAVAGEYQEIENPPESGGLIKDSFVVNYTADDFTDKIDEAKILYIPKDFSKQPAFLLRCRPYYTNFSVQYLEQEDKLKDSDETLANAAASFAKHGFVYNAKHDLKISTDGKSKRMEILVGGQNNHLTKLFKTDVEKSPGLLGMSFYFTFNYQEMPSFRGATNTDESEDTFELLNRALQNSQPLRMELDGRNAPDRDFELDIKRMQQAVPESVIDFCLTGRKLID